MKARILTIVIAICLLLSLTAFAQQQPQKDDGNGNGKFQVTSTTFTDGGTIPLVMVWNQCSAYPGGGNQSPELSWTKVPGNTRSFVVTMYDVTASFTHWGMYNISSQVHELPQNAGIPGSPYGTQVLNDYGVGDLSYDGPCPPTFLNPVSHMYVFTVYALDMVLPTIPSYGDFQPGSEALYQALIAAGQSGHIVRSANITGFFPQPQ
jgi:Raf kinase inhibitor-like YbhB/YbcL family protein